MTVSGEPAVEGIGVTRKPPPIIREGVGTRAVIRGTGKGGGRETVK